MSDKTTETDLLVAKLMAMEVMLLTLVRPAAANPKFWNDVDAVTKVFDNNAKQAPAQMQRRWNSVQRYLDEWRTALTPPDA